MGYLKIKDQKKRSFNPNPLSSMEGVYYFFLLPSWDSWFSAAPYWEMLVSLGIVNKILFFWAPFTLSISIRDRGEFRGLRKRGQYSFI